MIAQAAVPTRFLFSFFRRAENLVARAECFPQSLLQLMFRVAIGSVFWNAGLVKIASWQTTLLLFRNEYRVPLLPPELAAHLATAIELTCPILLFVGLATRLAVLPMIGQALVIEIFVYPEDWIEHLGWLAMLLFLFARGAGVFSVDHLIWRWVGKAAPAPLMSPSA